MIGLIDHRSADAVLAAAELSAPDRRRADRESVHQDLSALANFRLCREASNLASARSSLVSKLCILKQGVRRARRLATIKGAKRLSYRCSGRRFIRISGSVSERWQAPLPIWCLHFDRSLQNGHPAWGRFLGFKTAVVRTQQ